MLYHVASHLAWGSCHVRISYDIHWHSILPECFKILRLGFESVRRFDEKIIESAHLEGEIGDIGDVEPCLMHHLIAVSELLLCGAENYKDGALYLYPEW